MFFGTLRLVYFTIQLLDWCWSIFRSKCLNLIGVGQTNKTLSGSYVMNFYHNSHRYSLVIKSRMSKPLPFDEVISDGKDVRETLIRFLGPNKDFMGSKITPSDMNLSDIKLINGDSMIEFKKNEIIVL